jgi:phosphatidylserine decarboxylase
MKFHKEGIATIVITLLGLFALNFLTFFFAVFFIIQIVILVLSISFLFVILYFFRVPTRQPEYDESKVLAACDGKLVAIEEIDETEYFNDKRIQVSIFMSPLNVHINWVPVSGEVVYYKYHPGKHIVAWHPKSSTDNERATTVIKTKENREILVKQIAGAVARRIVCYADKNNVFKQGDELGFIKFGSRVDIILPLDAKINVSLDEIIIGNKTIIAELV